MPFFKEWCVFFELYFAFKFLDLFDIGGPPNNGKGGDGGDGNGGGGGGDDDGEDHIFLLPILTLAFAAFHVGYCIAVWVKDDSLDFEFFRTALALFGLLTISALRLNA
jgi:hypothetical protein